MRFLLDTNVLAYFFEARRHSELADAAAIEPCAIADDVKRELEADAQRHQLFATWMQSSSVGVLPIIVGSPADRVFCELESSASTARGRGERASIALASAEPRLTLVTMDKGALWIALRELWAPGERLIGLPVFLRRLVDGAALDRDAAQDVMEASRQLRPTWWVHWWKGDTDAPTRNLV